LILNFILLKFIKLQYQVHVPGIVFEYNSQTGGKDFAGWDYDDLVEVLIFIIYFYLLKCKLTTFSN